MKEKQNLKLYENKKIFLVEILGMTNYCNLRCEYCDWEKRKYTALTERKMKKVNENLQQARIFIQKHYPEAQMIEYSGGEPFFYPEIVWELLDIFPDYWVRVITNATLLKSKDIKKVADHGRAYLAISLDGHTISANHSRLLSQNQLDTIISNIDLALNSGVPVMLLCTINEDNIDEFENYVRFLDNKWRKFINDGMLVLPAHLLSSYAIRHRVASNEQINRFKEALIRMDSPIINNIKKHYNELYCDRKKQCSIYQWAASMHFLGDSISNSGEFTTYRCGMRGVGKIGTFNVLTENKFDTFSQIMNQVDEGDFAKYHCGCTVDWNVFDLILSGCISINQAQKWFKLFKDEKIQSWIKAHKSNFLNAYTRGGRCKKECITKRIGIK